MTERSRPARQRTPLTHTLDLPVALTAMAFVVGLFFIPLAPETLGEPPPK